MRDRKMEDAKACLQLFRETLSAESYQKYCEFLIYFRNGEIDLRAFLAGNTDLIKGHDGLAREFNKFMPQNYNAVLSDQVDASSSAAAAAAATSESDDRRTHKHEGDDNLRSDHDHDHGHGRVEPRKDEKEVSLGRCDDGNHDLAPSKFRTTRKKKIWETASFKKRRSECEKFLYRVRKIVDNVDTYRNFIELFNDYKEHKDLDRLDREILRLFRDEPGLHIEFTTFLVDAIEEREKDLERKRCLEISEGAVNQKEEGVSKVLTEKNPCNENLCRVEDGATTDNKKDTIHFMNKDIDLYCREDIADILTESPVRRSHKAEPFR